MKNKMIFSVIWLILSLALLIAGTVLAENKIINSKTAVAVIVISVVLVVASVLFLSKADYETGVYECRKCGHTFTPSLKAYIMGAHTINTRHLKCPACNKKSWCKRKSLPSDN